MIDPAQRALRRELARRRTRRQRRLAALLSLALLGALLAVLLVPLFSGADSESADEAAPDAARRTAAAPPELPRGGREILPRNRVVAFYGAPQHDELGALGIGSPAQAGRRLEQQARGYRRRDRPVLPAFELIAAVAAADPGRDGDYSDRQPAEVIDRYLRAARRREALLILDVQPGRSPFMREVRALGRWLSEPDVSLALDPEWSMTPGQAPGSEIGSTDAATINRVAAYLSGIVRSRNLPQKLLLVHRFMFDMIEDEERLRRHPGVALVINVDGFGDRPNKLAKYRDFTRGRRGPHDYTGFKLFYREDTNLMSPRRVLRMRPQPDVVVYE